MEELVISSPGNSAAGQPTARGMGLGSVAQSKSGIADAATTVLKIGASRLIGFVGSNGVAVTTAAGVLVTYSCSAIV